MRRWVMIALAVSGCTQPEGRAPDSCADGADNDGDGLFDCDDDGCVGSPDCAGTTPDPTSDTSSTSDTSNTSDTNSTSDTGQPCLPEQAVAGAQVVFDSTVALEPNTFALSVGAPSGTLPVGFEANDVIGAVAAGEPAWWADWTARNGAIEGDLPGGTVHPLEVEIETTDLTPSSTSFCTAIDPSYADGGTVTVFGALFPVCVVSSDITADTVWPNNHVFLIDGTVRVGTGDVALGAAAPSTSVSLTIQAGTQVYATQSPTTQLVVTRGSQLAAVGTSDLPILFSAVGTSGAPLITGDPTVLSGRGEWGGIVLSGRAAVQGGTVDGERTSTRRPSATTGWHGGARANDSSGSLSHVIIAEAGLSSGTPGLLLESVGSQTVLDNIQVFGSDGPCVAWQGGTAAATELVCQAPGTDGLVFESGVVGSLQYGLVRQGAGQGRTGVIIQNDDVADPSPRTAPRLANLTILGDAGSATDDTLGVLHRAGGAGEVYRSVVADTPGTTGFEAGCLGIEDALPAELTHADARFGCAAGALAGCDDEPAR